MIATIPGAPGAPYKVGNTMTSITIEWPAPTDDGATTITDYEVKMDSGDGNGFISLGFTGDGSVPQFTQAGLTPGEEYFFKVIASNIVGAGPDSVATKIIAGKEPGAPA